MVTYDSKTYEGLLNALGGVSLELKGDNRRVALNITINGGTQVTIRWMNTTTFTGIMWQGNIAQTTIFLYRDFGPLIQRNLFIEAVATSGEFVISEILYQL